MGYRATIGAAMVFPKRDTMAGLLEADGVLAASFVVWSLGRVVWGISVTGKVGELRCHSRFWSSRVRPF